MQINKWCIFLLFACFTTIAPASNLELNLTLQCNIAFTNYNNVEHATITKTTKLTNYKHKEGGAVLVSQTDDYEFWAMVHGVQEINNKKFINNFQVAIKNKHNNVFMHALSDTTHTAERAPKQARLSLVDYHPDSFLEKGELFFECLNQESW